MKLVKTNKLFQSVRELIEQSRTQVVRNVNTIMIYTNFTIGKMIVEEEQKGSSRADYAETIVKDLSVSLTSAYGKGFSKRNLDYFKQFYLLYRERIVQTVFAQFGSLADDVPVQTLLTMFADHFKIGWSHYLFLMKIQDTAERSFYEYEASTGSWSFRELQRQYQSSLFERLALSTDKNGVRELNETGRITESPIHALKNPVVLEFLGLKEDSGYSENDLETAIINKLEHFMLELEKAFCSRGGSDG